MADTGAAPSGAQSSSEDEVRHRKPQNAADLQKLHLERLMKRVDKPIHLPAGKSEAKVKAPKEFVRNVQGSSAGAGSGEFHVYRALRRKEYARQKMMDEEAKQDEEQRAFHEKLAAMKAEDDARMAKKREKRKKRKGGKQGGKDGNKKAKTDAAGAAKSAGSEGDGKEQSGGESSGEEEDAGEKNNGREDA
ncbi:hypothetical protein HDV00_005924 [Rhizophlyctis rosea]|nr:hypothetical protein HDV00_005924 [Rhizophlyctis rosea]